MTKIPSRYAKKDNSPKVVKKITEQECIEVLQGIKEEVLKAQGRIKTAYEEGPYWARLVKEGIIGDVTDLLEGYELSPDWNSEESHTLQNVKNLVSNYRSQLLEVNRAQGEIVSRMMTENTYYMLERLLGFSRRERPTIRIMDPKVRNIIKLHPEDI